MNKFPEIPKTQCIIVLAGCPACGKTTLAKEIYANRKDCVIVSRDSIREARGSYNVPEQEDYISDIEEASVRAAIKRGFLLLLMLLILILKLWKNGKNFL